MPEGHVLHRLARDHNALFRGRVVAASTLQDRFAAGAALIDGRSLVRADAWGKHLFHDYGAGVLLHVHLGLYGTFRHGPGSPPPAAGALRLRLVADTGWADLRGATTCAVITTAERKLLVNRLGPDPLRTDTVRSAVDVVAVQSRLARSRVPVALALTDQSIVAGVGNAFRAELLFRHRIDPYLPSLELAPEVVEALWDDLVGLLRAGVKTGHIVTTLREHRSRHRGPVAPDDQFYVYRRTGEPCRVCGTPVAVAELATRNLYWCPSCQASGSRGQVDLNR